jgi:hypothetical protein
MNLLQTLFYRKAEADVSDLPGRLHGQFTPSQKTRRTNARKASVEAQLGVYVATVPQEQREAETQAYFAVARSIRGREAGN